MGSVPNLLTANNTAVMRNLGLITGASVMGAVFAFASATIDITTARPEAVANGMRITFAVAAILIVVALAIAAGTYARPRFVTETGNALSAALPESGSTAASSETSL